MNMFFISFHYRRCKNCEKNIMCAVKLFDGCLFHRKGIELDWSTNTRRVSFRLRAPFVAIEPCQALFRFRIVIQFPFISMLVKNAKKERSLLRLPDLLQNILACLSPNIAYFPQRRASLPFVGFAMFFAGFDFILQDLFKFLHCHCFTPLSFQNQCSVIICIVKYANLLCFPEKPHRGIFWPKKKSPCQKREPFPKYQ